MEDLQDVAACHPIDMPSALRHATPGVEPLVFHFIKKCIGANFGLHKHLGINPEVCASKIAAFLFLRFGHYTKIFI